MTRRELAKGSVTFIAVIAAGLLSVTSLDRRYAGADKSLAYDERPLAAAPAASSTACVGVDGSWKNWAWPNVPMLSPKCADVR